MSCRRRVHFLWGVGFAAGRRRFFPGRVSGSREGWGCSRRVLGGAERHRAIHRVGWVARRRYGGAYLKIGSSSRTGCLSAVWLDGVARWVSTGTLLVRRRGRFVCVVGRAVCLDGCSMGGLASPCMVHSCRRAVGSGA